MFFRTPRFIRRWLRRRMHPMAEDTAFITKKKLSLLYAFIAWNAFGLVFYQVYNGNKNWPVTYGIMTKEEVEESPGMYFARTLQVPNAKIYRLKGTKLTEISDEDKLANKAVADALKEKAAAEGINEDIAVEIE